MNSTLNVHVYSKCSLTEFSNIDYIFIKDNWHQSIQDLLLKIDKSSVVLVLGFGKQELEKVLNKIHTQRKFNPVILFNSGLTPSETSSLIRKGAFAIYDSKNIENLSVILDKEKEDLLNFSTQKEKTFYVSLITENVNELVFEFDSDLELEKKWRLNYIGGQVEVLGGVTALDCIENQDLWWNMIHPDDISSIVQSTRMAVKTLTSQRREYRIKHASSGQYMWLEDNITPVYNSLGKVTSLYGVARSIHESKVLELELAAQTKFNENILSTSPGILYILDYETQLMIKGLNRFAEYLGFSVQEIEEMPNGVYSLIHPNDLQLVEEQEKALSDDQVGKVIPVEIRLQHKDENYLWVRIYSKIFERDEEGVAIKEIGSVVDISRIRESENIFKRIALNGNVGIVIIQDEKIKFANPGATNLLEYSNFELVDQDIIKFIAPGKSAVTREIFSGLYQKKFKIKRSDQVFLKKSGQELEVNITSTLISYQGKMAVMSVFLDDSVLKEAERTFRTLFDRSEDLIYVMNREGVFVNVNQSVSLQYGYSINEVIGKTPEFLGAPGKNDMQMVQEQIEKAWNGEVTRFDWWSIKKNGDIFPKEVILKKGRYFGDEVLIASGRDISNRHNAEQEKTKLIDQLLQQNRDLEQFAYVISHNMRSPVASILGLTQVFDTNDLSEENQELLDLVVQSTNAVDGVIQDLNKTLTIRKHQDELKEKIRIKYILDLVKLSLASSIKLTRAVISESYGDDLEVITIKSYLQNIIYNLISNAIKYRKEDSIPEIQIDVNVINDVIRIEVKDNGLGIDMKKLGKKLFGLYERFHLHIDGRGLGLYLVKQQTDALSGTITVKSVVGKGSTFIVDIPNG